MPDFRLQNNPIVSSIIDAAGRNAQLQEQAREAGNQSLLAGLKSIGDVGQSLYDTKKRVAQSLAIGRQFEIPEDVSRTMAPEQLLDVAKIKKGNVDLENIRALLRQANPGSGGTGTVVPTAPPQDPNAGASLPQPAPAMGSAALKPEAVLASTSPTIPIPAPTATPPSMPFGGSQQPGGTQQPGAAPSSIPVPIQAPPPKGVNAATMNAFFKLQPQAVVSQSKALADGSVPKGAKVINPASTDQVSWATASPQQQSLAQAVYEGRVRPSDVGFKDRGKITLLANEYAGQAGLPPFKGYLGDVNAGMAKYSTSGKLGQNALSLNTALGHAASAYDTYQTLGNTNQEWLNQPINKLRKITNDPNVVALGINLNALQGELGNVFKNTGATDQEIGHWKEYLNENLTPTQYVGALSKIDELLKSRLSAMEYQRASAGGGSGASLMSPHAQEISKRLSNPGQAAPNWTDDQEKRYQELLAKQKGK